MTTELVLFEGGKKRAHEGMSINYPKNVREKGSNALPIGSANG